MPLDERDAFQAMFRFLEGYWERTGRPDELGALLGSLSTEGFDDGMPADRALWSDWLAAIEAVRGQSGT